MIIANTCGHVSTQGRSQYLVYEPTRKSRDVETTTYRWTCRLGHNILCIALVTGVY